MKRTLLIAACGLLFAGAQAQTADQPKWSGTVENAVTSADDLNLSAPTAVDNAGNVYVTGSFRQGFAFGSSWLEATANSAYLGKYDANGNALWAVSLRGAATITAITTDEQNNVYIAGTLADAVVVGSTDGNNQNVSGKPGEVEYQVSSFIAAYDADGKLKATKVIWSELPSDLEINWMGGSVQATITNIKVAASKLYASVLYSGDLTVDNINWPGSYLKMDFGEGMVLYMERNSCGVLSADATTLTGSEAAANVTITGQYTEGADGVEGITMTSDEEDIYICFYGTGNLTYTKADGTSENLTFPIDAEITEYGYVVSAIKEGNVSSKTFSSSIASSANYRQIGDMKVEGDNLYITGSFQEELPFDNDVVAVDACDLFAACLNKNTFEPQWTAQTGLAEGDGVTNYDYENYSAMAVNKGTVSVYGYTIHSQDSETEITSTYVYNFSNGEATSSEAPFVTGADLNGTTLAVLTADDEALTTTVNVYNVEEGDDGINGVTTLETQRVGNTFYFAEPTDVDVYDLQGRMLMQEKAATTLSIDNLNRGIYILSSGTATLKVSK